MGKELRIALDAMGGDRAPGEIVKGAVTAVNKCSDVKVILVGDEAKIQAELSGQQYNEAQISIIHTTEEITFHDAPVAAVRKKKDSSLVVALNMVKEGKADAVISAGSSGAILAGGLFIVGRGKGIERAPLACLLPTSMGPIMLIDCGANVDTKPSQLVQFARIGSIYMKHVMNIPRPRVALVNIGIEEEKGNALTKEVYSMLKECEDLNFTGNIESREIPEGTADVAVCDAFVGNVILKLYEGLARTLMKEIKAGMMRTTVSKIGAFMLKDSLKKVLKRFDATEYGGAPLLGLNGLVVKCHGNASYKEISNAISQCVTFAEQDINAKIQEMFAGGQNEQ